MDSFDADTHTTSSMESFDTNDMNLHFGVMPDLSFGEWDLSAVSAQTNQQQQQQQTHHHHHHHHHHHQQQQQQQSINGCSDISSSNHQDFQHTINTMDVSPSFHMLPTPEGSDSSAGSDLMMSPFDMVASSGNVFSDEIFQDDEFFFQLEPAVMSRTTANDFTQFLANGIPPSPLTSPTLQPEITNSYARQPTNKNKSLPHGLNSLRNNNRYTPMKKQKSAGKYSVSASRQKKQQLQQQQQQLQFQQQQQQRQLNPSTPATVSKMMSTTPTTIMISNSIPMRISPKISISPIINSNIDNSPVNTPTRDSMPNLNLGNNLVSSISATQFPSNITSHSCILDHSDYNQASNQIAPITPATLMRLEKPKTSNQKQQQQFRHNKNQDHIESRQQQDIFMDKSTSQPIFISPQLPPSNQEKPNTFMMTTTGADANSLVSQPMLLISPGLTLSPVLLPSNPSSSSLPVRKIRKASHSNHNSNSSAVHGFTSNTKSPQALKPTISPNLKPKLYGILADEVAEQLAQKSNYQNILEGTAKSLGISYPSDLQSSLESRRTTHKAAEQKRRDSLKQSFDELKKVVPYKSMLNNNKSISSNSSNNGDSSSGGKNGDGTMKNVSKLFLLKRAHDHIVELQQKNKEKDDVIGKLMKELEALKGTSSLGDAEGELEGGELEGVELEGVELEGGELDGELDGECESDDESTFDNEKLTSDPNVES
ncbi:hypothetical protein G9A89_017803 [Geosiphon pyriformis]|nr:hypothetical protein G9A89_017803 [Geosiphon pyriformis]